MFCVEKGVVASRRWADSSGESHSQKVPTLKHHWLNEGLSKGFKINKKMVVMWSSIGPDILQNSEEWVKPCYLGVRAQHLEVLVALLGKAAVQSS